MLFAGTFSQFEFSGHIDDPTLTQELLSSWKQIQEIEADGDELERCCAILGRAIPPQRSHTFIGDNAKEIARNWF